MEIKIYWTDFAKSELKNIFDYYEENANAKIATKITKDIIKRTLNLADYPNIGKKEPLLVERVQEFRFLIYKNFKIIYWYNIEKNQIEISDIFDTRQNPIKLKRN